jgi:large subunit ribosomal protein L21
MFAIVRTGGKQYKVAPGATLRVEKIEAEAGQVVELRDVLAIGNDTALTVGRPFIDGAKVVVEVIRQYKDAKILVFKKVRRHNHRRKNGHRQQLSLLKVREIGVGSATAMAPAVESLEAASVPSASPVAPAAPRVEASPVVE